MGREIQAQLRRHTKRVAEPEWRKGLAERASSRLDQKVLVSSARVQVRDTNVVLRSGAVGKLKDITRPVEFGGDRNQETNYRGRRGAKRFKVTRHTARQLGWRRKGGRVVWPTAEELIPRMVALWVQTTVRTFHEALEKR
ncbi:hypothetical protein [Microbacterium hydrocarbonoxydans]|uniref:hypothetical protein n=1 Tax=Microbacterium hydrocarbonoxydans TaxID=273678 RepID=UPI003D971501